MLCLENSAKRGLILRTQQAECLQISTEDKTGKEVLPVRCVCLRSGFDVCQLFGVCVVEVSPTPGLSFSKKQCFWIKKLRSYQK